MVKALVLSPRNVLDCLYALSVFQPHVPKHNDVAITATQRQVSEHHLLLLVEMSPKRDRAIRKKRYPLELHPEVRRGVVIRPALLHLVFAFSHHAADLVNGVAVTALV